MPTDRDPDLPGGSDDPTRANDPVDPTRVHEPVDTADAQGAGPAAGMGLPGRSAAPFSEEPLGPDRRPRDDDRNTAAWLWALLAAVLIGIVLYALFGGLGDDDDAIGTIDPTTDTAAPDTAPADTATDDTAPDASPPEDTTADAGATTDDTTATTTAPQAPAAEAGTVTTTDGTDLRSLVQGDADDADRLAPYAGTDVTATDVEVLEVVDGEGVWIGTDGQRQLFARTTGDVSVEAGDRISFEGSLEANPAEDADDAFEIPEDQGAELLRQQGHHIEVGELTTA